jgi:amino acid transporter
MTPFYKLILIISVILIISFIIINIVLVKSRNNSINSYQKIILIIAVIILFFNLIFISVALHNSTNANWPPVIPSCPDYWLSDGSGNNITCTNVKDLGVCKPPSGTKHLTMNFNNTPFSGANGDCAKYTWANNCKVSWDGLTYGVGNPCA